MRTCFVIAVAMFVSVAAIGAPDGAQFDAAAAFGARPSSSAVALSPDGLSLSYVTPAGKGSALRTLSLTNKEAPPVVAVKLEEGGARIWGCAWVGMSRLACQLSGHSEFRGIQQTFTHLCTVNADGSDWAIEGQGHANYGGSVMDLLPDRDGEVLVSNSEGVGLLDTRTLRGKTIERKDRMTIGFLSDGMGNVRVKIDATSGVGFQTGPVVQYFYRLAGSTAWKKLSQYNAVERSGFFPLAVDPNLNIVYGMKKLDGRLAVYSVALDGSLSETLVFSRPDVDVAGLLQIGRRHRVVGATYITEQSEAYYFEAELQRLTESLSRAIPSNPMVRIIGSSADEQRLLLFASRDDDPGTYYLFDRENHQLQPLLLAREALEKVKLATVRPVTYAARDGANIPGYLTLPPGKEHAEGLPAIVIPHGGFASRDSWGFNWLAQYFANRGFAVLQPNFRGSWGYGDSWYLNNGYQSWPTAVGDVLDAGRWLVAQRIADPKKLGILGWSYGGYAALQAAIVDSSVYRAVIAIDPVTDLQLLKDQFANTRGLALEIQIMGTGPEIRTGSPAQNAEKIKVPVMLFSSAVNHNYLSKHSELMEKNLRAASVPVELVSWDKLDSQVDDADARAQMLRQSEAFLLKSFDQ